MRTVPRGGLCFFRTVLRAYASIGSDNQLLAYCADHNASSADIESLGDACFKCFEDLAITEQLYGALPVPLEETLQRRNMEHGDPAR